MVKKALVNASNSLSVKRTLCFYTLSIQPPWFQGGFFFAFPQFLVSAIGKIKRGTCEGEGSLRVSGD